MTHYGTAFLRSLGLSLVLFQIPTSLLLVKKHLIQEGEDQPMPVVLSGNDSRDSYISSSSKSPSKKQGGSSVEKPVQRSQYCPEGSNPNHCSLLTEIVNGLEEMKGGFSRRVFLSLPGGRKISIVEILKPENSEAQKLYLETRPKESIHESYLHSLEDRLIHLHWGSKMDIHTREVQEEIKKHFPTSGGGDYANWRYQTIFRRLSENGGDVILKPMELFDFYHFFKDPKRWGLMVEEAKYFYYSGGSKWAGWKDKNYIQNFTEALDTYIPLRRGT